MCQMQLKLIIQQSLKLYALIPINNCSVKRRMNILYLLPM